jgi:hypothetical protein
MLFEANLKGVYFSVLIGDGLHIRRVTRNTGLGMSTLALAFVMIEGSERLRSFEYRVATR